MNLSTSDSARAERASQILNDSLVKEAFDAIEKQIFDQWLACPVRDVEGREHIWRLIKAQQKFKDVFIGMIETGKLAQLREKKVKNG